MRLHKTIQNSRNSTATFDTHIVPTMGDPYYIGFDRDTLVILSQFQSCTASKEIKLEPSAACYSQLDSQSEIVNKEIMQLVRVCKVQGNR